MFDLVIKGGRIVDGTGAEPYTGDVAVRDGVLVQVGGTVEGDAAEVIDATGRVVTPGFVDVHTHYDGQAFFDETLSPSSGHGVTTVVLGVCGIGFAPARPDAHELLVRTMESVEDIPGDVLRAGIPWSWETFPQFLDALDARTYSIDVAAQIGHVPVRAYVMGQRALENGPASQADIAAMADVVKEAIEAGAVGFSTSRVMSHTTGDGTPVPGTFATEDELFGIAAGIAATGRRAVFQLAEAGVDGIEPDRAIKEVDWMRRLSAEFGLPVSFLILQSMSMPDLWRELMDACVDAEADGAVLRPQVANRPFGMLLGLRTRHPFVKRPTFQRVRAESGSFEELCATLARPDIRAAILGEGDTVDSGERFQSMGLIARSMPGVVFPLSEDPDYEPLDGDSLAARAAAAGVEPLELFYDLMLGYGGEALFLVPFFNYAHGNQDDIYEMLTHPAALMGLGDGGAHLATICDASMPTYQLSHWVKGRARGTRLPLEVAVKMQTHDTAAFYGFRDRGTLEVGKKADLNVIDLDRLALTTPRAVADLPTGATRLLQDAVGYDATVVSGVVIRRNDADTGARPGRLVRASG
ncbi:MAG TPA: amidohydrolase family protein [Acidimicrobiales bacterium]|nr:amidohydrolase family protein [Acidimicrobiales bacterium]